jgi:2',3'-cyclic-nucleotide 2'-phosphodiesterase (5'-nucleotidase family)
MVKLKNYNTPLIRFVLFLTFSISLSCSPAKPYVTRIEGSEIVIKAQNGESHDVEALIKPYRDKIDGDMNAVLAFAPQTIDRSGEWQSPLGNLFADATLHKAETLFESKENKSVDFCMLNAGGLRSVIPKGQVTVRTAYQIMPFENNVVVVEMDSIQLLEMLSYIIAEKRPHPLSGITFTIDKNQRPKNISVAGKAFNAGKIYYVATNDYLYSGGDSMLFFGKSRKMYDLDYKLRDVLIDYFKNNDTILAPANKRISIE